MAILSVGRLQFPGVDEQGAKDCFSVDIAQGIGAGALGVRHHAKYVTIFITDPGVSTRSECVLLPSQIGNRI